MDPIQKPPKERGSIVNNLLIGILYCMRLSQELLACMEEILGPKAIDEYPYTLIILVNLCYILLVILLKNSASLR